MIEYKIGKIEGEVSFDCKQKYVVNLEGEDLVFYAHAVDEDGRPRHKHIGMKFGLANILGGGWISFSSFSKKLKFLGYSRAFGGVPMSVLERFKGPV